MEIPVAPAANEKLAIEQETALAPKIAETPANTDAPASTPADITTPTNTEVPVEAITTAPVKTTAVEKSAALGQESAPNKNVVTETAEKTAPIVTKTAAKETTPPLQPATSEAEESTGRASNDPRSKPKAIGEVSITTETRGPSTAKPLDTSLPSPIAIESTQKSRPANDPRGQLKAATSEPNINAVDEEAKDSV